MEFYRKINHDDMIKRPLKPTTLSKSNLLPPPPSIIQSKNFASKNLKVNFDSVVTDGHLSNGGQKTTENSKVAQIHSIKPIDCQKSTEKPEVVKPSITQEKPAKTSNGLEPKQKLQDKNYLIVDEVKGSPLICPPRNTTTITSSTTTAAATTTTTTTTTTTNKTTTAEVLSDRKITKTPHWKMDPSYKKHKGGCHCGAVRFEVYGPEAPKVIECNCTVCVKKQNHHFIVPESHFKLLKGHDSLTTYTFNTHTAKHTFCSVCGVQSFYIPRSNSDGYGIVFHCLDGGTAKKTKYEKFDGQNWEIEIEKKTHIKKQSKIF